jgi:hypothetical protein
MTFHQPVSVAVLLHLSSTSNWLDFRTALQQIPGSYHLYINLVTGFNSPAEIEQQINLVRSDYPNVSITCSANRGMDVGGMFRLFAKVLDGPYQAMLYAHSKSDERWRRSMLQALTQHSTKAIRLLKGHATPSAKKIGMIGAYAYPYDYYNLGPYIAILEQLGIKLDSSWSRYFARYPAMRNVSLEQRIAHARDIDVEGLRPELDLEYASALLGKPDAMEQAMNPQLLRRFIADKTISGLPYFPGNFFWISMPLLRKLSTVIDFEEERAKLPLDLASDREFQSRAHAWERVLPVFAVKSGYGLHSLQGYAPE